MGGGVSRPDNSDKELSDLMICHSLDKNHSVDASCCATYVDIQEPGNHSDYYSEHEEFIDLVNRLGDQFASKLDFDSLCFLHELWDMVPQKFVQVINKLVRRSLYLEPGHIDQVVRLLNQQMELPDDILQSLAVCFEKHPGNITELTTRLLFVSHSQDLLISAEKRHLLHHSLPHALEISARVTQVMDNLHILTSMDPKTRFVRSIIVLMVQFHDLVQQTHMEKKLEQYSAEEQSAECVTDWLLESLNIPNDPEIEKLVRFISNSIIVLGTTMIFSETGTMDLSELYFEIKQVAVKAGLSLQNEMLADISKVSESKAGFMHCLETIMLLTGVCDKNPAAIYDVVAQQANDSALSTLILTKKHFSTSLLFERFFEASTFQNPFGKDVSPGINQQAFMMALVPHLSMRAELTMGSQRDNAIQFMQFIKMCREERLKQTSRYMFIDWFREECCRRDMNRVVSGFFFDAIDSEISFCKSQHAGLVFVNSMLENKLSINFNLPLIDARNLIALKEFYGKLNVSEQKVLVSEMLLAVVLQAGEMLAVQLRLNKPAEERLVQLASIGIKRQLQDVKLSFFPPVVSKATTQSSGDKHISSPAGAFL